MTKYAKLSLWEEGFLLLLLSPSVSGRGVSFSYSPLWERGRG